MTKYAKFIELVKADLTRHEKGRLSAWSKGVNEYAAEIVQEIAENINRGYISPEDDLCNKKLREKAMLNGAANWREYSWGGCSLIDDYDIAKRLCNPSELKRKKGGEKAPNNREQWLDTQARALYQASLRVHSALKYAYDTLYA